jgi:YbbR domain-containing protein
MRRPASVFRVTAGRWKQLAGNLPLALVSLLLASLLWIAVTNEENPTLTRDVPFQVPVEEVNVPRSFVVSSLQPDKVNVTLTGPRDRIGRIGRPDLSAQVNLSDAVPAGAPPSGQLIVKAPAEISIRSGGITAQVLPATIQVTLEPEVRKTVPVRVDSAGDALPVGFELSESLVSQPVEATIAGAEENVNLVDSVVAAAKLGGVTVNLNETVRLEPRDSGGHPIGHVAVTPAEASIAVKVHQVQYTRQVLVDARLRGRPSPGYVADDPTAEPVTVAVTGSLDLLNQVSALTTQDVDVQGATSDVVRTVGVQLPPGLTLGDPKGSVVVRVPVHAQTGPGAFAAVPKIIGLASGLAVSGQTPTVVVDVTGPIPSLLQLSSAEVVVTVDAGGLSAGNYRLEPRVILPAGVQLDGVVPDRVALTLIGPVSR